MATVTDLTTSVRDQLLDRNRIYEDFFTRESHRLALACREMSDRFLRGGRLLAFGRGPYATDAQHVSVEFVHPIIVGKRALPALDLSILPGPWLEAILHPDDIVMGFGPPNGDEEIEAALNIAANRGAMTFHFYASDCPSPARGAWRPAPTSDHPFLHQELIEILYHTLWETVHVFFEHNELGHDVGDSAFLYPFLGEQKEPSADVVDQVAASIRAKAHDDSQLRARVAREQSEQIIAFRVSQHERSFL